MGTGSSDDLTVAILRDHVRDQARGTALDGHEVHHHVCFDVQGNRFEVMVTASGDEGER